MMTTREAFDFLEALKKNNNTEWFHSQKKAYEAYKKWYHGTIAAVLEELKKWDPSLEPLEPKNCTFRINRDIRFSKDKSPYKTNIGMWFTHDKSQKNSPGYYIHYEKGASFIAGGVWCPEPEQLKKIRKEIEFFYEDLDEIVHEKSFATQYKSLSREEGNVLKKAPKDTDPNHPGIEFLKLKSFTAATPIADDQFLDSDFGKKIARDLAVLKPLNDFLRRALETEE